MYELENERRALTELREDLDWNPEWDKLYKDRKDLWGETKEREMVPRAKNSRPRRSDEEKEDNSIVLRKGRGQIDPGQLKHIREIERLERELEFYDLDEEEYRNLDYAQSKKKTRNPYFDRRKQKDVMLLQAVLPYGELFPKSWCHSFVSVCKGDTHLVFGFRVANSIAFPRHALNGAPDKLVNFDFDLSAPITNVQHVGEDWSICDCPAAFQSKLVNLRGKLVTLGEIDPLSLTAGGYLMTTSGFYSVRDLKVTSYERENALANVYHTHPDAKLTPSHPVLKYVGTNYFGLCGSILVVATASSGPVIIGSHRYGSDASPHGYSIPVDALIEYFQRARTLQN